MGVHRKEVKLKEVIKLGGLYTTLTKERLLGLRGTINWEKAAITSMRELVEDTGYFSKIVYAHSSWCPLSISSNKSCSSLPGIRGNKRK